MKQPKLRVVRASELITPWPTSDDNDASQQKSKLPSDFEEWLHKPPMPQAEMPKCKIVAEQMRSWRHGPNAHFTAIKAHLFRYRCRQPHGLIELLNGPGIHELNDPIVWTFHALSESRDLPTSETIVSIPLNRIFSYVWRAERLEHIFSFPKKSKPPPIRVSEVEFEGEVFYTLEDGNHRCEAAKMRRATTIDAIIESFEIVKRSEWRVTARGLKNITNGKYLPRGVDTRAVARWLGVRPL